MHKLKRAKLAELVQLLTGRDFETRDFKEEIVDDTFKQMYEGVLNVISQHNFTQFMLAIKSAGFISSKMVTSNMALDFAIPYTCCSKSQMCLLLNENALFRNGMCCLL